MKSKMLLTEDDLLEELRERCKNAGGAKPWSEQQKPRIAFGYVCAVLRKEVKPGQRILNALGLIKLTDMYTKKADRKTVIMKFENI